MPKKKNGWERAARPGEVLGGGYVILRREPLFGRVRPSFTPFEYDNQGDADIQSDVLAQKFPGYSFEVFKRVSITRISVPAPAVKETEAA